MVGQGTSDANKQAFDAKRLARGGILSANSGGDWSCLSIVQNDRRRCPARRCVKAVSLRHRNRLFTMVGGTGEYADKGRTHRVEIISQLD